MGVDYYTDLLKNNTDDLLENLIFLKNEEEGFADPDVVNNFKDEITESKEIIKDYFSSFGTQFQTKRVSKYIDLVHKHFDEEDTANTTPDTIRRFIYQSDSLPNAGSKSKRKKPKKTKRKKTKRKKPKKTKRKKSKKKLKTKERKKRMKRVE